MQTIRFSIWHPVLCPACSDFVSTSDVKSADERFHEQLTKLPVKCGKCEKTMSYDLISHHNCDTNSPLSIQSTSESVIIETPGEKHAHSTPKPNKSHVEMQIQTSPIFGTFTQEESSDSTFNKTASRSKERFHTHLTKRKLNFAKENIIACKTGGQPLLLKRIVKPRKESANVSSPLKRRRAHQSALYRVAVAGKSKDSHSAQQSSELKVLSKNSTLKICSNAGVKQKSFLS